MFALIKTGGKQYKVAHEDVLVVEKLDAEAGDDIAFDQVLLVSGEAGTTVGAPMIEDAAVLAEVLEQRKGDKIIVFKKKRRNTYRRKQGHRQLETVIKITAILPKGAKAELAGKKKHKVVETSEEVVVVPAAKRAPKAEAPKAEAVAAVAGPLKFLDAPQGTPDDLKDISGVGPVLEKKLHTLGIFHFHQIAAMDEATLTAVDAEIGFKGRAMREDWIGQAKHLMAGGEPLAASDREAKADREEKAAEAKAPKAKKKKSEE
jgi:large subunit ribosomal protein L21